MSTLEDLGLPDIAAEKLARHQNKQLRDALGHPLRRQIVREIQFAAAPQSVSDLVERASGSLRSVRPKVVNYHAGVLCDRGVLNPVGEIVTARDTQPIYLSTVAADRVVSEVLAETADLDLRWGG